MMRSAPRLRTALPDVVSTILKRGIGILACFVIAGTAFAETVPAVGDEFRDCAECPLMRVVPAGQFEKGPPPSASGHFHNEGVVRTIIIARPFAVGKFEISVAQWRACVASGRCEGGERAEPDGPDYPAVGVSWDAAVAYTEWLAELTGKPYRLLSETEWEYAARAGLPRFRYFSMTPEQVCQVANVYDLSSKAEFDFDWEHLPCDDGFAALAPTGSLQPNAFGLHDMLGNVAEWTEDCHNRSWRFAKLDGSAWLEGDCLVRAYRGGSWLVNQPRYLRTPDRYRYYRARSDDLGFRVGLSLP